MDNADPVADVVMILPELARRLRLKPRPTTSDRPRPSLSQIKAMTHLAQSGQQTMTGLARGLDISLPAATDLVDRLISAGLAERIRDDIDRRIVFVRLTPTARARIEPILDYRRRAVSDVIEQLEPDERATFIKGLRLLSAALAEERSALGKEPSGE
jgi:DNA-binding MarR family transcriptional regulator